jgi:hypothetical protein
MDDWPTEPYLALVEVRPKRLGITSIRECSRHAEARRSKAIELRSKNHGGPSSEAPRDLAVEFRG